MAITGHEIIGRIVSNDNVERMYYLHGPADENNVVDFIESLPGVIAGFPFTDFNATEVGEIVGDWNVTCTWGTSKDSQNEQEVGTSGYRFSFQAPSAHIYQSLATINIYEDSDLLPFGCADFGGAINVVNDAGKLKVEGYNMQPPPEVFTLPYTDMNVKITPTYQATVRDICGKVNSTTYRGIAAGQLMLCRCEGSKQGGLWNLEFGFGYIKNTTGEVYGNITGVAKDGMDLLWPYFKATKDDTAKELCKRPAAIIIDRIYYRTDFAALAIPA